MINTNAYVSGHSIILGAMTSESTYMSLPEGSSGVDQITFTFYGSDWNSYSTRYLVCWQDPAEIFSVALSSNVGIIPGGALAKPGYLHVALKGVDSTGNIMTTHDVVIEVRPGAPIPSSYAEAAAYADAIYPCSYNSTSWAVVNMYIKRGMTAMFRTTYNGEVYTFSANQYGSTITFHAYSTSKHLVCDLSTANGWQSIREVAS